MVAALAGCGAKDDNVLRVGGSTTVAAVMPAAIVEVGLRGATIHLDTAGGSSQGIAGVAEGDIDLGMASRELSEHDRAKFPKADFRVVPIGLDAVAIAVNARVYASGVRWIDAQQARDLFEGKITTWKQLGGADTAPFVYDKELGRGTREGFEKWVYGKSTPPVPSFARYATVGSNQEGLTKTAGHDDGVTLLSIAWVEREPNLRALALRLADGTTVEATDATIRSGAYPLARRLNLITNGAPTSTAQAMIDFFLSGKGHEALNEQGFLPFKP
jgi:phosphate transport system substrate-binding protein